MLIIHANTALPKKKTTFNPLSETEKAANTALSSERIVVENVIGSLKRFRVFSQSYRNRRKRFSLRFNLISAIHNFELSVMQQVYYNFVKVHQTLKVTPALEAGLTNRLWDVADLVALIDANEPAPKKRSPYKKRISK